MLLINPVWYDNKSDNYPTIWNKPLADILLNDSKSGFKSRLNTFLFNNRFYPAQPTLRPAPLKLSAHGPINWTIIIIRPIIIKPKRH